jgi:hypothetical protein
MSCVTWETNDDVVFDALSNHRVNPLEGSPM